MARTDRFQWLRLTALAVALATTACTADAVARRSAQPEPTPTPRPTPTPVDVLAAYEAIVSERSFAGRAELSGHARIGDVDGSTSEFIDFIGTDFHSRWVTVIGDQERVEEIIHVDGEVFERENSGPWMLQTDAGADFRWPLQRLLREAHLRDAGRATRDGVGLHRLVLARPLPPDAVGPADASGETELEVLVEPSGKPVAVVMTQSWVEITADGPVEVRVKAEFSLELGHSGPISPPDDAWVRFASPRLPYTAARPVSWELVPSDVEDRDVLVFPDGELQVVFYPVADVTSDVWFAQSLSLLERDLSGVETGETLTVAGQEARLFSAEYLDPTDVPYTFRQVTFIHGGSGWDVNIYSYPGAAPRALEQLMTFLDTFEPTDHVEAVEPAATSGTGGNVWGLAPGQCFNGALLLGFPGQSLIFVGGVDGFQAVACDAEHSGEVIATLTDDDHDACDPAFEAYVGEPLAGSGLALFHFMPTALDGAPAGLRGLCAAVVPGGSSGSARAGP